MLQVKRYQPEYKTQWDDFVDKSKNATFLFKRDFMEYHADRFEDFSLLVFEDEKIKALFPANRVESTFYSHQGLTYGGLLIESKTKMSIFIQLFREILLFLEKENINLLHIKQLPNIYPNQPADELLYIMFLCQAQLYRRDILSVIDLREKIAISKNRMEGVKRGYKNQLVVKETTNFSEYWNEILLPNLQQKHKVSPVHTLEEITLLHSRFPKNIRQFNVYQGSKIVAGTTVFETKNVAHSQYISANSDKNTIGSLDYLHYHLITEVFAHKKYFDFGTSNEQQGKN